MTASCRNAVKSFVETFLAVGSTANNVTFVDSRHQNEDAENPPTKFDDACPWFFHRRRSILGVDVTESFDSFLAHLSSQATSTDAITRGVAIETYRGAQGDGPGTASDKHILTMCAM